MKNYAYTLWLLAFLSIMSCKTTATPNEESNAEEQNKLQCKDMIWYQFINGKPSSVYLERSKKVAERWGFEIKYALGSCTNSKEDQEMDSISKQNSIPLLTCLRKNVGENWKSKFHEEVKKELNN